MKIILITLAIILLPYIMTTNAQNKYFGDTLTTAKTSTTFPLYGRYKYIMVSVISDTTVNYYDTLTVYNKSVYNDSSRVCVRNITPLGTDIFTDLVNIVNYTNKWTQYLILRPYANDLILNWINTVKNNRKIIIIIEAVK